MRKKYISSNNNNNNTGLGKMWAELWTTKTKMTNYVNVIVMFYGFISFSHSEREKKIMFEQHIQLRILRLN